MSRFYGKVDLPPNDLRKVIRSALPRASEETVDFMVEALLCGESFDFLEAQRNIDGMVAPLCRNTFYKKRRLVIAQLERR